MVHAMTHRMGPYQALEDHPGHRSTAVQTWHAQDVRSGHDVALTVVAPVPADVTHRMVELAGTVRHPHLLPVLDVIVDGPRVGLVSAWPGAGRLCDLLERRGRLAVGETLTVLRPLAGALAAIHRHGFVHGNLSAAAVWFDDSGRPLLGGLAAGLIAAHAAPEVDGPPNGAADLAPEVARGGAPSVAADIFSLGSMALRCLTGRSAWPADDPADVLVQSVGGVWPDVPDDVAPPRLVALVRRMLASDPGARPEAPGVLAELQRSGVAVPVELALDGAIPPAATGDPVAGGLTFGDPERGATDAATEVLAGLPAVVLGPASGESARDEPADPMPAAHWGSSGPAGAVRTGPPIVRRRPDAANRPGSGSDGGPSPARRRHGREQAGPARQRGSNTADPRGSALSGSRRLAVLALTAALSVVLGVIAMQAWSSRSEDASPAAGSAASGSAPDTTDWLSVVTELDTARAQALSAADPALLDGVYTASSAQRSADAAVVTDLAAKGLRVRDGTHQIASATLLPVPVAAADVAGSDVARSDVAGPGSDAPSTALDGSDRPENATVRVAVVDALPSYPIVDQAGSPVGQTAARSEERRIMVLASTAQGYRIEAVLAG